MKLENKHLCYADRKLHENGYGIHEVVDMIVARYGVSHDYAKAVVIEVKVQFYLG